MAQDNNVVLQCTVCSRRLETGQRFCPECGTEYVPASTGPVTCSRCKAVVPSHLKFCEQCGTELITAPSRSAACSNCKTAVPSHLNFCERCGTKVGAPPATPLLGVSAGKALRRTDLIGRLMNLWWHRLPFNLRMWPLSATTLSDGAYLIKWPTVAAFGPPLAASVGFLLGWLRLSPGETYTYSLTLMAVMMIISGFSAALGAWFCGGYAIGDFFFFRPTLLSSGTLLADPVFSLTRVGGPAVLLYLLLLNLLVLAPYVSSIVRRRTLVRAKALLETLKLTLVVTLLGMACQALVYAALVYVWTQSVPLLIRPVWTWTGNAPTVAAMAPLQEAGMWLVYLAVLLGAGRVALEHSALRRLEVLVPLHVWETLLGSAVQRRASRLPAWVSAVGGAALTTFVLAGMLSTWIDAALLWIAITTIMICRSIIAQRFGAWTTVVNWVPVVVRVAACWWISYVLAQYILSTGWGSVDSFRPMLFSTVVSLAAFAALVPGARREKKSAQRVLTPQ